MFEGNEEIKDELIPDEDEERIEEVIEEDEEQEKIKKKLEDKSQTLVSDTTRLATDMGREAVICSRYEKFKEKVLPTILGIIDLVESVTPIPFNIIPKIIKTGFEVMQNSNSLKEIFENSFEAAKNIINSITKTFSKNEKTTEIVEKGANFMTEFFKIISEPIIDSINKNANKANSQAPQAQSEQISGAGNELDSLITNQQEATLQAASTELADSTGLNKKQEQSK